MLARVPAWLWLVLLLLAAFSVQDWRHRRALADLQGVIDDRAVQAIEDARALVKTDLDGLARATESAKAASQPALTGTNRSACTLDALKSGAIVTILAPL